MTYGKWKKEKGITLVILAVIIIVLLILAGVSISLIWGNDGISSKAQNISEKALVGQEQEKLTTLILNLASKQMVTGDEVILSDLEGQLKHYIGNEKDVNNKDAWLKKVTLKEENQTEEIEVVSNNDNTFIIKLRDDNGMPEVVKH